MTKGVPCEPDRSTGPLHVFLAFLFIGCTAFGGPVAHRARFRELLVRDREPVSGTDDLFQRVQLRPQLFEDLWVFANLLPGPSSSQVAIAIGKIHCGGPGAFAAWMGFTLPTALLAAAGGQLVFAYRQALPPGLIAGLLIAVFVVILNAVRSMLCDHQKQLVPLVLASGRLAAGRRSGREWKEALASYRKQDGMHAAVAAFTCAIVVLAMNGHPLLVQALALVANTFSGGPTYDWASQNLLQAFQFGVIPLGLALGILFFPGKTRPEGVEGAKPPCMPPGYGWLIVFAVLLGAAALSWALAPGIWLADLAARFYRVGALVFGGGHVVLPLLEVEVVPTGLVDREVFLIGYGAIQALPGPLFAFATFLGTVATPGPGAMPGGWLGGLVAVVAIFAPSLFLVSGLLGVFLKHRDHRLVRKALNGANAAVVGILGAALWPIWNAAFDKWHALDLSHPAFWLASLVLLALLVGVRIPGGRHAMDPAQTPVQGRGQRALLNAILRTQTNSANAITAVLRLPAPFVVIGAALGGWALGG